MAPGAVSHAATVAPPSPLVTRRLPAGELVTLVGERNSLTRRAAVRTPCRLARRSASQTATVLPDASVASCGESPNSPSVWVRPSLPLVVIRQRSRLTPLLVRARQRTSARPVNGWTATADCGLSDELPTRAVGLQRPAWQVAR